MARKVKIVSTVLSTDSAGNVVDALPVREESGPTLDAAGKYVDPIEVEVDDTFGAPVRYVSGLMTTDSAGRVVPIAPIVGAGVFYVSAAGNDNNSGRTPATAWATLAKVNATTFNRGERVLFHGGDTFAGQLIPTVPNVLSVGEPVVYGAYGTGRAIIEPVGNAETGILAVNPTDITIRDLHVIGTGIATGTAPGVHLQVTAGGDVKLTGVKVLNCEVEQFGDSGITVTGENGSSGLGGLEIAYNLVHDCTGNTTTGYGMGIYIWGNYGLVANEPTHTAPHIHHCIVYNCTGKAGLSSQSGSGILVEECEDALIEWCVAYNNGANCNYAGGGPVGIWTFDSIRTVIQFCVSHSNKSGTNLDGGGFDLDGGCVDCVIQYCYSQGNEGSGYQLYVFDDSSVPNSSGNIIRYNISEDDGTKNATAKGGIGIGCAKAADQSGNLIYGNTIYTSVASASAVIFYNSAQNSRFVNGLLANNIFFVTGTSGRLIYTAGTPTPPASFAIEGNLYWTPNTFNFKWGATSYTTIATWKTAATKEQLGTPLSADPLFAGTVPVGPLDSFDLVALAAYQTQANSPARNGGVDLTALYGIDPPQDMFGNAVPDGGFDVGCFEGDGYTFANNEAKALVARFTTQPANARKELVDTLVGAIKTAGVWSKLDFLYIMAAHDAQAARRNWVADAFNLTAVSSPTFTTDRGYAGDGATANLSTGVAPNALTQYVQNSAHLAAWLQSSGTGAYITRSAGGQPNLLAPSTTNLLARINKASGNDMIKPVASHVGFLLAQRISSTSVVGYEEGAAIGTEASQTSGAKDSATLLLLLSATHRLAVVSAGASLTDGEETAFYNALATYIAAVGA